MNDLGCSCCDRLAECIEGADDRRARHERVCLLPELPEAPRRPYDARALRLEAVERLGYPTGTYACGPVEGLDVRDWR